MKKFLSIRKTFFAAILASLVLFTSCSPNDERSGSLVISFDKYERGFYDEFIIGIGVRHNSQLNDLFGTNPQNTEDLTQWALTQFQRNEIESQDYKNYFEYLDKINTSFLVNLIDENKDFFVHSEALKNYLSEIKNISDIDLLKEHEAEARMELEGIDLDLYLILNTIYQYSTEFWNSELQNNNPLIENDVNSMLDWRETGGISAVLKVIDLFGVSASLADVTIPDEASIDIDTGKAKGVFVSLFYGELSALSSVYAILN